MKFYSFALLLSLTALTGCAKDKSEAAQTTSPNSALSSNDPCAMIDCQKPKASSPPSATVTPLFLDAQRMAQNVQLSCQNGDCDSSVGLLSITLEHEGDWNVGQCTASLVAPDTLVTNGHCIPPDLEASGSGCANRIWINFAEEAAHPEFDRQVGCKQVLFRHKDKGVDGADYAYIQLARAVNRPVLRQSQAGFEENKRYHLHKINPIRVPDGMAGQMQKVDCHSLYDSAIFSHRLDARSLTSFLVDCQVLKGNSGSPLLDDQGSVRGVIYAFEDKNFLRKVFDQHGSSVPALDQIADLNVASNFACLTLPGDPEGRNLSPACASGTVRPGQSRASESAQLAKTLKLGVKKMIAENAALQPNVLAFGWSASTYSSDSLGLVGKGVPECIMHSLAAGVSAHETKIHLPFFYVRADYDKYFRASNPAPVWAGFAKTALNLHLDKKDGDTFLLELTDPATGQAELSSALRYCQK